MPSCRSLSAAHLASPVFLISLPWATRADFVPICLQVYRRGGYPLVSVEYLAKMSFHSNAFRASSFDLVVGGICDPRKGRTRQASLVRGESGAPLSFQICLPGRAEIHCRLLPCYQPESARLSLLSTVASLVGLLAYMDWYSKPNRQITSCTLCSRLPKGPLCPVYLSAISIAS